MYKLFNIIMLCIFYPLFGYAQLNAFQANKLDEIIEYKYLLSQVGHVGWDYINNQPKVDEKPLVDSLDQYSNEIDRYINSSFKNGKIVRVELLLEIILKSKKHQGIVNQKVNQIFLLSKDLDDRKETFQYVLKFLSLLGKEKFKHRDSIEYCLNKLEEGRRIYMGRSNGYHFTAYLFYLSIVCKDDKKVKKRLKRVLKKKSFLNDETIKKQYEKLFEN